MTQRLQASRASLMDTYPPPPVTFVSGSGTVLVDTDGKHYLDFLSGIAVVSIGHAHPHVANAVEQQARRLVHVSNLFGNELGPQLARSLDRLVGDGEPASGKVFFANSGAEANECAIKLARRYFSRHGDAHAPRFAVVSAYGSFHGRTLATLHATGQPEKHAGYAPLPAGFTHVPFGDLTAMAEATDGPETAAVLLEVIQGEGGVVPAPAGYLEAVRALCDRKGLLLIVDEIQTGLGRTGRWFAFHRTGVKPDIVTIAKALGNGFPIGACWARDAVASAFQPGDHGSTFGGQPLACAAALATLEVMEDLDAPAQAARAGRRLADGLASIPGIAQVRGDGLLLGAVLAPSLDSKAIVRAALERGLVLNAPTADVVRFAPPLTVSDEEIDAALAIVRSVLEELS